MYARLTQAYRLTQCLLPSVVRIDAIHVTKSVPDVLKEIET